MQHRGDKDRFLLRLAGDSMNAFACLLLLAALWAPPAKVQPLPTHLADVRLPDAAVDLARGDVPDGVAQAMIGAGVPTGLVIATEGFRPAVSRPIEPSALDRTVRLEEVLAVVSERHPSLTWRYEQGVVVIHGHQSGPCDEALERPLAEFVFAGSAIDALNRLVRQARGQQGDGVPPGLVGGGGGMRAQDGEEAAALYQTPVTVRLTSPSVEQVLNEIVLQAPGVGWAVRGTEVEPAAGGGWAHRSRCVVELFTARTWLVTTLDLLEP